MQYNKICLMVPTYKRHDTYLPTFINSAIDKCSDYNNICMSFCVNENDYDTINYISNEVEWPFGMQWEIINENTIVPNLSYYYNLLYDKTSFKSDDIVVSMVGDDMEFITHGYDIDILKNINQYEGIGVFWCNDDFMAKETMCVNLFVTRKFVTMTGKEFMCPYFRADMIDAVWKIVGDGTNTCHYLKDTIIKHNHNISKTINKYDYTFNRLRPQQEMANKNVKLAKIYAKTIVNNMKISGII